MTTRKTTEQYWKDRYKLRDSLGDRTEEEMLNHLKELYQNTMLEIDKEIQAFYGRYAYNNDLTLSEVKKRLNPQELKSAKQEIAKYYSEIDKLVRKADGTVSVKLLRKYKDELRLQSAKAYMSRLEDLKIRIKNSLVKLGLNENEIIFDSLMKTSEKAYTKSAYELSKYMGFGNTYSENQFEKIVNERWLGENYSDRVWENKQLLEQQLEKTFLQGVVRGQNPRKIASEMQQNMGGAYYRCERLARTEMIHTLNESTMQSYKDYNVQKYQFVCGLDERTCPDCGALDGEVFEIKDKIEGVNYPVIHPNCRCTTIPFFEKDEIDAMFDESSRVAYTKDHDIYEVPASMSYAQWVDKFKEK
jgi:SPP1 gp7 family putative phage head morphogenesis protein